MAGNGEYSQPNSGHEDSNTSRLKVPFRSWKVPQEQRETAATENWNTYRRVEVFRPENLHKLKTNQQGCRAAVFDEINRHKTCRTLKRNP
ncbi:UNVERIFIED_CONTAM: hypothetical protein Sradi_7166500 [Sesamum radiatum]|uniref:Uncharacterized protein n=1 Tax=Sesamum radiatum TaxID=300843 RepID=A0AAW2IUC4_SESRA